MGAQAQLQVDIDVLIDLISSKLSSDTNTAIKMVGVEGAIVSGNSLGGSRTSFEKVKGLSFAENKQVGEVLIQDSVDIKISENQFDSAVTNLGNGQLEEILDNLVAAKSKMTEHTAKDKPATISNSVLRNFFVELVSKLGAEIVGKVVLTSPHSASVFHLPLW